MVTAVTVTACERGRGRRRLCDTTEWRLRVAGPVSERASGVGRWASERGCADSVGCDGLWAVGSECLVSLRLCVSGRGAPRILRSLGGSRSVRVRWLLAVQPAHSNVRALPP